MKRRHSKLSGSLLVTALASLIFYATTSCAEELSTIADTCIPSTAIPSPWGLEGLNEESSFEPLYLEPPGHSAQSIVAAEKPSQSVEWGELEAASVQSRSSRPWQFEFSPYGYLPALRGNLSKNNFGSTYDLSHRQFFDLVKDEIDGLFLGSVKAKRDRFSLMADLIWMRFDDVSVDALGIGARFPNLPGPELSLDWEQLMIQFGGGYTICQSETPSGRPMSIDLTGGARYLYISGGGGVEFPALGVQIGLDGSENFWEPWIGTEINCPLNARTNLVVFGDITPSGMGDSAATNWQLGGKLQYSVTSNVTLDLGYRGVHLEYEDDYKGGSLNFKQVGHGPQVGITYRF